MNSPFASVGIPPRRTWIAIGWRTLNLVGLLVVVLVVGAFAVYAIPGAVGADESYVVASGSMEPVLSPGDVIFVYSVEPTGIDEGDVIVYGTGASTIPTTHRVVEVVQTDEGDGGVAFRTKGDANEEADLALVPGSQVQGRVPVVDLPLVGTVLVALPFVGYVVQFGNTTSGFILLLVVPVLLFVVNEGWRIASTTVDRTESDASTSDARSESTETVGVDGAERTDGMGGEHPATQEPVADAGEPDAEYAHPLGQVGYVLIGSDPKSAVALSSRDLTITSGVLALGTVYAGWVAYNGLTALSVAAAVAAFGGLGFALALRHVAAQSPPMPAPTPGTATGDAADHDHGPESTGVDFLPDGELVYTSGSGTDDESTDVLAADRREYSASNHTNGEGATEPSEPSESSGEQR